MGAKRIGKRHPSKVENQKGLLVTVPPIEGSVVALFEACGIAKGLINESALCNVLNAHGANFTPSKLNGKRFLRGGGEFAEYALTTDERKIVQLVLCQLIGQLSSVNIALGKAF